MNWETIAYVVVIAVAWGFNHWLEGRRFTTRECAWEKQILAYEREIERLYNDNKDLRDRLFQSKAMPPSGVDLTEVYEERKQAGREHKEHSGKKLPPGPIERLEAKWKEKDLKAAQGGIDYTESNRAN